MVTKTQEPCSSRFVYETKKKKTMNQLPLTREEVDMYSSLG